MAKLSLSIWMFFLITTIQASPTFAAVSKFKGLTPDLKYVADSKKTYVYRSDGVVDGGDRAINDVVVLDVRHNVDQAKRGYERIVIDVEGTHMGETSPIERPPYFHVSIEREAKQVVFTIMGNPKLAFNSNKVVRAFKKSRLIKKVKVYPVLTKDRWTFVMHLAKKVPIEVFELTNPLRIIMDVKSR